MKDVLLFNGPNALDFHDVRSNVIRIPEVVQRVRQAQAIWDTMERSDLDLSNFIASDDAVFLGNLKLKCMAAAIVQIGLFDRYIKTHKQPAYLLGNAKGDSPLQVAAGHISFEFLVQNSQALDVYRPHSSVQIVEDEPVLSGISLAEYSVLEQEQSGEECFYKEINLNNAEINPILQEMIDELEVKKFINIGPGNLVLDRQQNDLSLLDVQVLESIDVDPMLSWFWPKLKEAASA